MIRIILLSYSKGNYILVSSFKLVIFVCLAIPSYGQSVVGITDGDVIMNWTITDSNTSDPRSVSTPRGQHIFFFASGSIDPTLTSLNYTQRTVYLGDLSRSIVSFNLSRLKVEDAGRYTFKILSMIVGGQVLVMAVSPSQPVVTEVVAAVLGSDYKLNCFALSRSEPSDHGMIMRSEWKINGESVAMSARYTVQNTELTISGLTRQDNGTRVTCVAYEDQRVKSHESVPFGISVKFGPDNIQLSPSGASLVVENNSTRIICTADCNPFCFFHWVRSTSVTPVSISQTLFFDKVTRRHADTYTCYVSNNITRRNASISTTVTVIYGAEIKDFSVQKGITVNENESATFHCSVDSYPKSTITLKRESDGTVLKTEVNALQSQYWLPSAHCLDTDNYTCSASNNISQPAVRTIQFFVKCHPRLDFRAPFDNITYSKHLGDAVLRYRVISYPPPRFTWTFLGNGSESRGLPNSAIQSDNGHQSELRFTKVNIGDLGLYEVIADNAINPPATAVLWLVVADVPETPSNVTITDITHNSLRVQWVSGSNGGQDQTFYIVASASEKNISVYAPDPGYQKVGSAVINSLLPNTEYSIYMLANNSIGTSNITIAVTALTDKESIVDRQTGPPVAALAGGIGAGCAVILVALLVVYLSRRYQNTKKGLDEDDLNRELEERKKPESGKSKKKGIKVQDPGKMYAEVHKTPKQGKKGDIYENATLAKESSADNVYENPGRLAADPSSVYENPEASATKDQLVNKDGLLYADLMLGQSTTKAVKPIIHGLENQTEYAEIAFGKRGEPLP